MIVGNAIRNKILNYKYVVNSVYVGEEISLSLNTNLGDCEKSRICDPHHKHIITGNLTITGTKKLRKLLTKGANYKETRSTNFEKVYFEIVQALEACMENIFAPQRESVLTMVKEKIKKLKQKIQPKQTKPISCDPDVISSLETLHKRFAAVTI